ncbi:MAG: fused MFS/spermidine synthase [Opitutae bacterium]|nr:fused MFS/spermidine synthase [Opitutae bacterium]
MRPTLAAPPAPPRLLRRPEWWLAGLLAVATLGVRLGLRPPAVALSFEIYFQLASVFVSGALAALFAVFGELLVRALPAGPRRPARFVWLAATGALALAIFLRVRPPLATVLMRLGESGALSLFCTAGLLALFLPLAGFIRWRDLGRAAGEVLGRWLPLLVYLACASPLMAATLATTPLVLDPVLWRMDLSLGFNPSEAIFAWEFDRDWVRLVSQWGYPLLGGFIAGVAAWLHLAGAAAQCRRCLLALALVATLGLVAYQLVPAVCPIHAFPGLFERPADTPELQAQAASLRHAIVAGPDRVAARPSLARNVMPSLHTAFTLVALAAAWHGRRKFFWLCLPVGAGQIFTALTLCVHYAVDLVAAVPLAALCWALADWLIRRSPLSGEEPLPPLARPRASVWAFVVSLVVALAALLGWGRCAPLSPWLAWPLVGLIAGVPAWLSLRVFAVVRPAPAPPPLNSSAPRLLAVAVFCTGGTALILEQVSEKYLSTLLGASRPAATIVLAVYFAGLALGAWLCPKKSAGAPRRLAALELFIAAWAVLVGVAFFACDRALGAWLAQAGSGAFPLAAARAALAALWLLPPTLAMGAQLPTLAAVLASHPVWRGQKLARYYALNLAGAFAFTVATPVLLFNTVGAGGALWTVAVLGGIVGLALWFGLPASVSPHVAVSPAPLLPARTPPPFSPSAFPPFLPLAFAAGFVFFALEVVWLHLIGAVCGASVFSFSWLLAVVLLGLALAGHRVQRGAPAGLAALAPTLAWLLVSLALGGLLWPRAGRLLVLAQAELRLEWFWAGELLKFCVVALVVLPSAVALGKIFPLLLRQFENSPAGSRAVGWLCAANVVGCVTGALAAGFGLIPALGAERTLFALAAAVGLGWLAAVARRPAAFAPLAPGLAGGLLLVVLPPWDRLELTRGFGVYLAPQLAPQAALVFFREDFSAGFVTVVATPAPDRVAPVKTLLQNGKFDADDAGEMPAQLGFGLVAALHAPAQDRALVIGCGSGQTAALIARLGFAQVDLAELSPAHLAAARQEFAHINAGVLDRPNVAVHVEDGRNFLLRTRARYDVIQIEVSSVWFAGATNLYSREFYALARDRLAPGGVLVQWVQLHHLTPRELAVIFATAQAEFPSVAVWRAGAQACLVASGRPPVVNPAVWEKWRWSPELFDERLLTGLTTRAAFAAGELLNPAQLRALLARSPGGLNTDRNRWLEFQTPQYAFSRRPHGEENLRWLAAARER